MRRAGFFRFLTVLLLLSLSFHLHTAGASETFSVKRIGNLIPFQDNSFKIEAPEAGKIIISVQDDISVYRTLEEDVQAGETILHWDGCAYNHEKLAAKQYTIYASFVGVSGQKYESSFNTPVEYTGQCLQYALPSSGILSLAEPEDWFVEFKTVQKGEVVFQFQDAADAQHLKTYHVNTIGGRIYRLTYSDLSGRDPLSVAAYNVSVFESTKPEEAFHFSLEVQEAPVEKKPVFLTGNILPEEGVSEEEIWQIMQQPSVVIDIDFFKHQEVYTEKDPKSASLGTLHGQTQALQVMKLEDDWAYIGAWNHEAAEYVEGWVPASRLKVSEPSPDYGILINKKKQTLDLYYRGRIIDTLEVSTGRTVGKHTEQETSAGSFLTGYHRVDFSTNGKKFDYVIQYDGGNLLHQIPYEWGKNKKDFSVGRGSLGAKASHACIRMQSEPGKNGINAYWVWSHIPYHTRVIILDDPEERRPVTLGPEIIDGSLQPDEHQVLLRFEDAGPEGENTPAISTEEVDGHRIGIASCTEKEYLKKPSAVTERIQALQDQACEKIILLCFWTDKNSEAHSSIQESMARRGIRAGADLVIGNGTKMVLGCEAYESGMILYGLGNEKLTKGKKKDAGISLAAEVLFDFQKDGRPTVMLKPLKQNVDPLMIAERLSSDSVGSGIAEIRLSTSP